MKKLIKIALLFLVIFLTACTNDTHYEASTLQIYYVGIDETSITQFVSDFRKSHPAEKVKYVDMNAYENGKRLGYENVAEQKLITELLGGNGPDLIIFKSGIAPFRDLEKTIKSGAFEALDLYVQRDESFNYDDYYEPVFEAGRLDGKLYAMPYSFTMPLYISSEEHMTANNISYDSWNSIADLTNDMSSFIQSGNKMHFIDAYSFLFRNNFYYNTNDIFDRKNSTININSEKSKQLLQASKLLYQTEKPLDSSSIGVHTVENTILMPSTSIIIGLSQAITLDEMGHTPILIPIKDNGNIRARVDIGMVINANSKNKQSAYDFMRMMLQPGDNYGEMSSDSISKENFNYVVTRQNHEGKVDAIKNSSNFLEQYRSLFNDIDSCVFSGGMYDEFSDLILPYFKDETTLDEAIQTAQSAMEIYISE